MQPATTSAQALTNLQQFQGGMKNPADFLSADQQATGATQAQQQLTGLQGAIANTSNLLNQVAPSVMGRTENSLVTAAQAQRIIGNEQAPIQTNLQNLGQQESQASSQYQTAEQQAEARANAESQGQQQKLGNLQSIYQALVGKEQAAADEAYRQQQAAAQATQFAATQAEQQREFNAQQAAASRAGSGSPSIGGGGSAGGGGSQAAAQAGGGNVNDFSNLQNAQRIALQARSIYKNYGAAFDALARAYGLPRGVDYSTSSNPILRNIDAALKYAFLPATPVPHNTNARQLGGLIFS